MKPNPVGWFEIYVADMARARKFYETVFACKLEALPFEGMEMYSFPMDMTSTGSGGTLCKVEGMSPGMGGTLVYFSCDDCAVEAGRVAAAGGKVHQEKMSIGMYGWIALVIDTEGNLIGLHTAPKM